MLEVSHASFNTATSSKGVTGSGIRMAVIDNIATFRTEGVNCSTASNEAFGSK